MIIGFKVTQSCAESRVVQEWNLIIEGISWETKHNLIVVIWKQSLTETSLISALFPLRVFFFAQNSACYLLLLFHCCCVALADWNIWVTSVCGCSYLYTQIQSISPLCFPTLWRKFSEASLEITCPTATDFQNYLFFFPHRNQLANNCTFEKTLPITTNGFAESLFSQS